MFFPVLEVAMDKFSLLGLVGALTSCATTPQSQGLVYALAGAKASTAYVLPQGEVIDCAYAEKSDCGWSLFQCGYWRDVNFLCLDDVDIISIGADTGLIEINGQSQFSEVSKVPQLKNLKGL